MEEFELGNGDYLVGKIVSEDCSFSHEFGTESGTAFNIHNLEVWTTFKDSEYEITKQLPDSELESLKELWIDALSGEEGEAA